MAKTIKANKYFTLIILLTICFFVGCGGGGDDSKEITADDDSSSNSGVDPDILNYSDKVKISIDGGDVVQYMNNADWEYKLLKIGFVSPHCVSVICNLYKIVDTDNSETVCEAGAYKINFGMGSDENELQPGLKFVFTDPDETYMFGNSSMTVDPPDFRIYHCDDDGEDYYQIVPGTKNVVEITDYEEEVSISGTFSFFFKNEENGDEKRITGEFEFNLTDNFYWLDDA